MTQPSFAPESVATVLRRLLAHPADFLVRRWNWKMAIWSGVMRTPIFVAAAFSSGPREIVEAGGSEFLYRFISAGYSAALVQALRHAQPSWLALMLLMVCLPATLIVLEWLLHWWLGTPNLGKGMAGSITMTVVAILFNFYSMRRGAFLSAGEGGTFAADTRQIPRLILGFITWPYRLIVSPEDERS